MINKITRIKLGVFVTIATLALAVTALGYVRLPQQVGIGRYGIDVELASAGGLYAQASVTYRGVEIGKVTDVDLGPGGSVVARLQIDNGIEIPRDAVAEVRSASVIGEQYLNFVPPPDTSATEMLTDGATVPVDQTVLPATTHTLLTSVDDLLRSIPRNDLRTLVGELRTATQGVGDDLGRLIDDSRTFQQEASANLPETVKLLEDSAPVLRTQQQLDPNIRSFAADLSSLSGQLRTADAELRGVLRAGAPFMKTVGTLATDLEPVLPGMLAELADTGEVLRVYRNHLEHLLIVAPAMIPYVTAAVPPNVRDGSRSPANLWFKVGFDPPTCTTGFENAGRMRDPSDYSSAPLPGNSWCKVPEGDPRAPRGARNQPCPNGGTGATARICGLVFDKSVVPLTDLPVGDVGPGTTTTGTLDATTTEELLDTPEGNTVRNPETLADLLKGLMQ